MPLRFTGRETRAASFENILEAMDGEERVVVAASQEALDDHGLADVKSKASEKYAASKFDEHGRIVVRTTDFT